GRPVNNVHIYIVDNYLSPVPLGAPGEIVFSGICVGRGYLNDPERTRLAYLPDPHRKGQRMYRGGDFGRWLADGKLEFLGRRDNQVKIRGFRIEIGEVENALLRVPGVRNAAVVVASQASQDQLVAFYTSPGPLQTAQLHSQLTSSLPAYMVPAAFRWLPSLPLTGNSKIDRKALTALAAEAADTADYQAPGTPTEQRLAAVWSKVLGISPEKISRRDHFFDLGGTSLSAVKLAIALERQVALKDIAGHPILADLAALIDGRSEPAPGLLQPLAEPDGDRTGSLICIPYAGGNAVSFQTLASALKDCGLAVYAVELPGHDLTDSEPFAPVEQVSERLAAEITLRGLTRIMLWGHSSGTALAVATARQLQDRGADVAHIFLGAQLAGDAASRDAAVAELTARTDAEIAIKLVADTGYTGLGDLERQRAERVAAAYRHDCVCAHRYFADALVKAPPVKLSAPVTVVVADDDPITAESAARYRDWQFLAEHVSLHQLSDGGHYFPRTRSAQTAQAILRTAGVLSSA
ncbi:MAG: alpha/beta fold hydrolase, partial [Actinobacteria bacterium]|nr:alpha/beta fold hydrolase [Actinomycetota bacterium]